MIDLSTQYMGLRLDNPLVPSASPLSRDVDMVRRLEDAGAAAIVMESLFEEQIESGEGDSRPASGRDMEFVAPWLGPVHEHPSGVARSEEYLEHVLRLKEAVSIPVIASLNGTTLGGWTRYANLIEQAGADALELNIYSMATDLEATAQDVEANCIEIVQAVRHAVAIPIAVKIGPFFSAFASMAHRLDRAGADGLVLFNRFYQPDFDLDRMQVVSNVLLSTPQAMRLPLRWIAILRGRVHASLAASSGIHTAEDVLKMLLAGADVTQMASALLEHGPDHLRVVLAGMTSWMEARDIASVAELKGSLSYGSTCDAARYERAYYVQTMKDDRGSGAAPNFIMERRRRSQ